MRIISGKFKGKNINLPKDKTTRPLRDLVKEALFNVIAHSITVDPDEIDLVKSKEYCELKRETG